MFFNYPLASRQFQNFASLTERPLRCRPGLSLISFRTNSIYSSQVFRPWLDTLYKNSCFHSTILILLRVQKIIIFFVCLHFICILRRLLNAHERQIALSGFFAKWHRCNLCINDFYNLDNFFGMVMIGLNTED